MTMKNCQEVKKKNYGKNGRYLKYIEHQTSFFERNKRLRKNLYGNFPYTRAHMKCSQVYFAQGKMLKDNTLHYTFGILVFKNVRCPVHLFHSPSIEMQMMILQVDPERKWNSKWKKTTILSTNRKTKLEGIEMPEKSNIQIMGNFHHDFRSVF